MQKTIDNGNFSSTHSIEHMGSVEPTHEHEINEAETTVYLRESKLGSPDEGRARAEVNTALNRVEQLPLPYEKMSEVGRRLEDFRLWEQELHNTDHKADVDFALWEAEMTQSSLDNYELTNSRQ